jgi:hypothetical protein
VFLGWAGRESRARWPHGHAHIDAGEVAPMALLGRLLLVEARIGQVAAQIEDAQAFAGERVVGVGAADDRRATGDRQLMAAVDAG